MASDDTVMISRDLALDLLAAVESLAAMATAWLSVLDEAEMRNLMDARAASEALFDVVWGQSGSGPEGRL